MSRPQMRASVLTGINRLSLEMVDIPKLDPDQVLIKVSAVGVCGSDVHYFQYGKIGPYVVNEPLILGHELSGRITEIGSEVDSSRLGKRVAVEPQRPCKVCEQCKTGHYNLCPNIEFFATPPINGAFCEYVAIQSEYAFDIPENITDEAAALIEPLSVCISAAKRAKIGIGARVLIAGAGPIGVIMAQTAIAFGASEVIVTDIAEGRRDFALQNGATKTLNPAEGKVEGLDVDVFIDASGSESAIQNGIQNVGSVGCAILVGLGKDDMTIPISTIQNREIWVSGVFRYTNTWPLGIDLVSRGKVNLDSLVTGRFGLDEVEAALNAGRTSGSMKAIVRPNG